MQRCIIAPNQSSMFGPGNFQAPAFNNFQQGTPILDYIRDSLASEIQEKYPMFKHKISRIVEKYAGSSFMVDIKLTSPDGTTTEKTFLIEISSGGNGNGNGNAPQSITFPFKVGGQYRSSNPPYQPQVVNGGLQQFRIDPPRPPQNPPQPQVNGGRQQLRSDPPNGQQLRSDPPNGQQFRSGPPNGQQFRSDPPNGQQFRSDPPQPPPNPPQLPPIISSFKVNGDILTLKGQNLPVPLFICAVDDSGQYGTFCAQNSDIVNLSTNKTYPQLDFEAKNVIDNFSKDIVVVYNGKPINYLIGDKIQNLSQSQFENKLFKMVGSSKY